MTLRHLRVFIAVAECGSMSGAAQQLYIAQPSVSQAIAELEQHYGCKLFERLSRRLFITPAGEELLGYARHIVSLFGEMEQQLRLASESPALRVGATLTVGTCVLGDILADMRRTLPALRAAVRVANTAEIAHALLRCELDVGLVEGAVTDPDLVCVPVIRDELVLVTAPDHPFAARPSVTLAEVSQQNLILREKGSGTRALFERRLLDAELPVREGWVCASTEAIKNAVAAGSGITVISRRLVERELREHLLAQVPIRDCRFLRDFCLVQHKDKYRSHALEVFEACCRRYPDQQYTPDQA